MMVSFGLWFALIVMAARIMQGVYYICRSPNEGLRFGCVAFLPLECLALWAIWEVLP